MLHIAFYICSFSIVTAACSFVLLAITRPYTKSPKDLDEVAPDADYNIRWQKAVIAAAATAGLVCNILNVAWLRPRIHTHAPKWTNEIAWSDAALWAYICVLVLFFVLATRHNVAFVLTCHIAILSIVKFILSMTLLSDLIQPMVMRSLPAAEIMSSVQVVLSSIATAAALTMVITSINVPRAPPMEHRGKPVISLVYGSLWNQFLFVYTEKVQRISRAQQTISQGDLDMLMPSSRAQNLLSRFAETRRTQYGFSRRLWIALKPYLIVQWCMSVVMGVLMYAPAFFLLKVLNFISEYKSQVVSHPSQTIYTGLGWVAGMFIFKQISAFIDSQLWYISAAVLQVNARAAINLEVYDKTLCKQNTSGEKSDEQKNKDTKPAAADVNGKDKDKKDENEDESLASKQNVMNLMTVDSDRISTFFTFCFLGIQAPIEIIVSIVFLYKLLGWAALIGFAVMCLFVPVTSVTSKLYSKTQDRLMAVRDKRVGLINEILQGIRQIKFQSNERYFMKKAQDIRNKELYQLSISYYAYIAIDFCYSLAPVSITVVTFGVYSLYIAPLTPSIAFTSLVIMNQMRFALNFIPEIVVEAISTWTSVKRIGKYLESEEVEEQITEYANSPSEPRPIVLQDVSFAFAGSKTDEDAFKLHHISAEFPVGELSLVTGSTGSGKTLLLTGILGEAYIVSGKVDVPRSYSQSTSSDHVPRERWIQHNTIAYVAQTAWLENKSIKDNILFGAPFVGDRYQETLVVCGLSADLKILEDGDLTEIGEKGINLSGGQKARVSLARAVYSRASVLIMDDVLSALDAHVAKHVLDNCINGKLLAGRTRILVTHQISLCLKTAKYVLALENGTTKHVGHVTDLKRTGSLANLVDEISEPGSSLMEQAKDEAVVEAPKTQPEVENNTKPADTVKKPRVLVDEESKFKGQVKGKVYMRYLLAQGSVFFGMLIICLYILELLLVTLSTYWLRAWSSKEQEASVLLMTIFKSPKHSALYVVSGLIEIGDDHPMSFWIGYYLLISVVAEVCGLTGTGLVFWGNVHAGRKIYASMLETIMRAPLRFLDTVPTGRLLNRFSKDAETVDSKMGRNFAFFLKSGMKMTLVLVICVSVQPICIVAAAILVSFGIFIGAQYTSSTRALKRLDSVNRSPMYETFSSTLSGITTIRAYGSSTRFMEAMYSKVDNVTQAQFFNMCVNRWLSVRFDTIGNFYAVAMATFIIFKIDSIDAGLAGFTLSFALELQDQLLWTIRFFAELEQSMNAVERVFEYTDIETEAPHYIEDKMPPAAWPSLGTIEFRDLELKYAPELPSVLHGVKFQIQPHEKIGIIGRTGSGKTTITLALFRFLEAHKGCIMIDGLDISKMGLHDLRSRLTIVPQEPTLFQGTLRSNLSEDASDHELKDALRRVHLISNTPSGTRTPGSMSNKNVFEDLDYAVTEHGSNFSAGQRQLLCLARALLRRTKIIVMDEATASVDVETDAIIQETIRSEFVDSTVLTIAHRLATIIDYDRILVLDHGRVLEFDTPKTLLAREDSTFSQMVRAANLDTTQVK